MVSSFSLDNHSLRMHKYYKKISSSAVSLLDPQFIGQKKELILNELGATLCKINRKCGDICLFENPSLLGAKRIKIKRKHHHQKRPRPVELKEPTIKFAKSIEQNSKREKRHPEKTDMFESQRIKDNKEPKPNKHLKKHDSDDLSKAKYSRDEPRKDESGNVGRVRRHRTRGSSKATKEQLQKELEDLGTNVRHLYEDSKTEIYFVNEPKGRKRKLKTARYDDSHDIQKDETFNKNFTHKHHSRNSRNHRECHGKNTESTSIMDHPITVATLAQLQHLFFRQTTKTDDLKAKDHKKHSESHTKRIHKRKHSDVHDFPSAHYHHLARKNLMQGSREPSIVDDEILNTKHAEELSYQYPPLSRERRSNYPSSDRKKDSKRKHKKEDKISLRLVEKSKKHRKKKDAVDTLETDSNAPAKSLFQNLHVNFGKCILMEDSKLKNKLVNPNGSVFNSDAMTQNSRIRNWIKTQLTSNFSKDTMKKIESSTKRRKSETSIPCTSSHQISPLPSKLYRKRSHLSGRTEHGSFKNTVDDLFAFEKEIDSKLSKISTRDKIAGHPVKDKEDIRYGLSRSKSSIPFVTESKVEELTTPPEVTEVIKSVDSTYRKLSNIDYGYFAEKLKKVLGDGSLKDVENELNILKRASQRSLSTKQKLKRLVRTSYSCIFEYPPTYYIPRTSSKSRSRSHKKNEPEMILCDNTVSIEDKWISEKRKPRIHLQKVSVISLEDADSKKEETDIEISSVKNDSMEITNVRKQPPDSKEGESPPKVVVTETKPQSHDSDNSNAEISKNKLSNDIVVSLKEPSLSFATEGNIYSVKPEPPETLTSMVFHIVDIPPLNSSGDNEDTCKLKPSIKKVTFPDEFEEMVERRKRTSSPFRRYYRYANDCIDVSDIGSQTLDAVFLSDYHVADCVSDSYEDEEYADESLLKPTKSTTSLMPRKFPVRIVSRIPVKIVNGKSRLTKQDTMRRRDIRLLSDSSSRISTSGSSKDFDPKKENFIPKQNAWIQKALYISRASSPLDASRNAQENYGFGDERGKKTVGVVCGVPAVQSANTSYHVVEARNRSTPSSIKTDSEMHSARSSRSRSSWNVIKNPVDIPSHSIVENRPVSKSTFRCSENSFPISTGSLSHQYYKVDDDGKVDGRVLIDELLKRIASIKQEVVSPYEYSYANRIVQPSEARPVRSKKKEPFDGGYGEKYCMSKSLSPPKSRLPVHFCYLPENSRARSFVEERKYKAKNYKTKNQESKKAKETPKTKRTKRSSCKSAPPTPVGVSTDSEAVNVPKEEAKATDLSVIASKSETNLKPPSTPRDKLKSYSRMSSRITVDHLSPPSRLPKPSQKPEESSSSRKDTLKDNLANPNSSTLFLTKDYKDKAHLNSYQRRKNYDLNIRKHWKTRSDSEEKKYVVPPQVFEVRYVTITKDAEKQNAVFTTRSTQNTIARSCQVSNTSSNYENTLDCASKENISAPIEEKPSANENEILHIAPREKSEVNRENSPERDGEKPRILAAGEKLEVTFCETAVDSDHTSTNEDRCLEKKLSELTRGSKVSLSIRKKARHRKKKKKRLPRKSEISIQEQHSGEGDVITLHSTELGSNLYKKATKDPVAHVTTSVSGNRNISKDNLLDTALRFAANVSFDCRKDLIKNLQHEFSSSLPFATLALETNRSISFSDQVLVNKDTKWEQKKVNDGSGSLCFKDYLCNAFCCCCVRDTDEPPNKRRKCSNSKKQRAKKKTRKAEHSVTQNFRVHLERTLDINYVKSGLDLKLTFGEKNDNQTDPDCNQNERVTVKNDFYPIEWFRNIKNFVYHEQNVDGCLSTLPSKSLDSLDNHFGSEVGSSGDKSCLANVGQSDNSGFVSQENSSNKDIPKTALLVKSKSEITFTAMQNIECSSLTSNLQTTTSLSTSYSSCLPNSIDESSIEADHSLDEAKMESHLDPNEKSHFVDVSSLKTIHQSSADLDRLKSISLSKFTRESDNNSCDLLLSSKESGYTSLPSSKTPSPTSFFKRKSIMDLLKFPVERRKSKSIIIDVNNCTDCLANNETQELFKTDYASVNSCSSIDDFLRVNRFNKMAKDCQMYAHKVRMLSMKKKDGIYEEQDNYREISLDVLLGRNPKCARDKNNHPFAYKTGSQCLIVLDDSKSMLSLVGSTIEEDLSCVGDKQNVHCTTEESSATSLTISNSCDHFTKSSKSEGMLVLNGEGTRGNLQVTRSENFVERNDLSPDIDLKRLSFENFSTNLSTKMADRDFFQKLLMVYEKENEIAERLYHDDEFFNSELEALREKNDHSRKKKRKGIFSMFKRKRKEDMSLVGDSICGKTSTIDDASQTNLDQFSSESCKDDWFSVASDKANSSDDLEGTSPETFRKLACQVRRHFGPMVKALNATKFANDDFKLNGFLKLLENIEQGDVSILQRNDICSVEERTKEQVRHCFGSLYEALREVVVRKKSKITPVQLDFIKLLSTTYRNYVDTYVNTLAVHIENGTISTEKQLKAAVAFLMRLDGKEVDHRDFENCIERNA